MLRQNIVICQYKEDYYNVMLGNRSADCLNRGEVLALVAALLVPERECERKELNLLRFRKCNK